MRFIFIVVFMVSFGSVSMSGVGDVYYCEMINLVSINDHKINNYESQKFKFKWDQSQIKFGKSSYFEDVIATIIWQIGNEVNNAFEAKDGGLHLKFDKGNLYFGQTAFSQVVSGSAKFEKF